MVRPRKFSDERMLTAAGAVIGRLGPAFTLADVAREAEVAVGTLARRFGSKHGLLVAMTEAAIVGLRQRMGTAADVPDPVAALVDLLVSAYAPLDDPATAANNLAQLAVDLSDDELRGLMARFYAAMEDGLSPLLDRAVAGGALPGAPPVAVAARILTAVADGAAVHWSTRPVGGLCDRLRTDLEAILAGWRHGATTKESR